MAGDDFIGRVIDGRYQVGAEIGEGAMGVVYRCRHVRLDKDLAIKILRRERGHSSDIVHRFVKEAKMASSLKHPNVVDLSDCGELPDGGAYIVMELLEGEALAETLARERRVAPKVAFEIVLQIAAGLKAAHDCEIVHRDLKPENVFLCTGPNGEPRVKLLDFGIARAKDSKDTLPGAVLGTPEYMAPEQARGEVVDTRADLYALGVMLFELLSGRVPLYAEDVAELLRLKLTAEPMRLRNAAVDLQRLTATDALVAELLHRDPNKRIQTIAEVEQRLRDALERDFSDQPHNPKATRGIGSGEVVEPKGHTAYSRAVDGAWQRPGTQLPSVGQHPEAKGMTVPASSASRSAAAVAISYSGGTAPALSDELPLVQSSQHVVPWDEGEPTRPGSEITDPHARPIALAATPRPSSATPLVLAAALLSGAAVAGGVLLMGSGDDDAAAQPAPPAANATEQPKSDAVPVAGAARPTEPAAPPATAEAPVPADAAVAPPAEVPPKPEPPTEPQPDAAPDAAVGDRPNAPRPAPRTRPNSRKPTPSVPPSPPSIAERLPEPEPEPAKAGFDLQDPWGNGEP